MKNFTGEIIALRTKHSWSQKVVSKLSVDFSYAIKQNQNDPVSLKGALAAIIPHSFGDHTQCINQQWCQYNVKGETYKHKRLPHGRDLSGESLREALQQVVSRYMTEPMLIKLSTLQSTNCNENMNALISRKAPKNGYYGGSESLDYRVSAAVCQKNDGHSYLTKVNEKHHLSPGKFTEQRFVQLDRTRELRKETQNNVEYKRRRLELKIERNEQTYTKEILEGATYQTAVDRVMSATDVTPIPEPLLDPGPEIFRDSSPRNLVCFDLETTGGGYEDEILQITAKDWKTGDVFSVYVRPSKKTITRRISTLTGIEIHGGTMYHNLQPVPADSITVSLSSFDTWLRRHEATFLVAHNASFDSRMLMNASIRTGQNVCSTVLAFIDTLPIFKRAFPGMSNYKLQTLVQEQIKRDYDAHNAEADTDVLSALCDLIPNEFLDLNKIATSIGRVRYKILKVQNEKAYLESFSDIVDKKLLTKVDAKLIAGSGLSFTHVCKIYQRSGQEALVKILKTVGLKKPSVSVEKIVESVRSK